MTLEQQQINTHLATIGVVKCPTACSVKTRGVRISAIDTKALNRHQTIQNRINYLKKLLFEQGPIYAVFYFWT